MTKKDQGIIDANAGVSPHDLLTLHGLSENGFNELVSGKENEAQVNLNSRKPVVPNMGHILKPELSHVLPHQAHSTGERVRVVPINGSGHGTEMDKVHAEKFVRSYPNEYKIV